MSKPNVKYPDPKMEIRALDFGNPLHALRVDHARSLAQPTAAAAGASRER